MSEMTWSYHFWKETLLHCIMIRWWVGNVITFPNYTCTVYMAYRLSRALGTLLHPRRWLLCETLGKCTQRGNLATEWYLTCIISVVSLTVSYPRHWFAPVVDKFNFIVLLYFKICFIICICIGLDSIPIHFPIQVLFVFSSFSATKVLKYAYLMCSYHNQFTAAQCYVNIVYLEFINSCHHLESCFHYRSPWRDAS